MKSCDVPLFPARRLFRRRGFDFDPAGFTFAFADFALTFSTLDFLGFLLDVVFGWGTAFDFPAAFADALAFAFAVAFKVSGPLRSFFLGTTESSTASIVFL